MTDFLIVGRGLAAATLAHALHKRGLTFKMIGEGSLSSCSRVAAGIWNPIVFKRLTKSWMADEFIDCLNRFYADCETRTRQKFVTQRQIVKPFTENQEKDLWLKKANGELKNFLVPETHTDSFPGSDLLKINNGYGIVDHCGNLDVARFLDATTTFFNESVITEIFDHKQLQISDGKIVYKELSAKNILFCEGHLVKDNPFFNWIPLKPAKGEVLTIQAPELQLGKTIFNRNGFLLEIANGLYKAGATYAWDDLSETPTIAAKADLVEKIKNMSTCNYAIIRHEAGVRPSSIDRRPIIGPHPVHANVFVFNGLGTKGVMLAPFFSENFVNFYLQKEQLNPEAHVNRFYKLYGEKS